MPIAAQTIVDRVRQVGLDAEGADYYDDIIDIIPAINAAQEWLVATINAAFGQKKMGEEVFQDLVRARVFQTNQFSRIKFDSAILGEDIWTILGVYPNPTVLLEKVIGQGVVSGETPAIFITPTPETSLYRDDLAHHSGEHSATRLTIEEWAKNKNNPFAAGNVIIGTDCDTVSFAYLNYVDYSAAAAPYAVVSEIEIRPVLSKELCTVYYAKKPNVIAAVGDNIEFPGFFTNFIFNKTLNYIATKQGDGTTVYQVTQNDINVLLQSIT